MCTNKYKPYLGICCAQVASMSQVTRLGPSNTKFAGQSNKQVVPGSCELLRQSLEVATNQFSDATNEMLLVAIYGELDKSGQAAETEIRD